MGKVMPDKFVFLDRDGTIILEKDYLSDPALVELLPQAAEGMKKLLAAGFRLIIVTNQSGIGRGYYSEEDYAKVTARLLELLSGQGVAVEGVYHCPHAPDESCACRKPLLGLLEQAECDLGCGFTLGAVIGDKPADVELGRAAGLKSILVRTGYGKKHEEKKSCEPDYIADNLSDSADWIIKNI